MPVSTCAETAGGPAWSPNGQRIAFSCRGLLVMNADGRSQRRLINDLVFRPVWSPDGKRIAYNCNPYSERFKADPLLLGRALQFEQFEVCVIRVDGSGFTSLTKNEKVFDGHPDWW